MQKRSNAVFILSTILSISGYALHLEAKPFSSSYLQFEIPNDWNCNFRKTYYYCSNANTKTSKEALIILTAKQIGPEDTLDRIAKKLNIPKTITNANGLAIQSKVYETNYVNINNHRWVKSVHVNSENQEYYTYYLATTANGLSILFTLSLNQNYVKNYKQLINSIFTTLKLIKPSTVNDPQEASPIPISENAEQTIEDELTKGPGVFGLDKTTLFIAIAFVGGILLLGSSFIGKRPQKKKRKGRK